MTERRNVVVVAVGMVLALIYLPYKKIASWLKWLSISGSRSWN